MITSVYVSGQGPHRTLTVRWNGQTIGELKVERADVCKVLTALRPETIEPEAVWGEYARHLKAQRETNPLSDRPRLKAGR